MELMWQHGAAGCPPLISALVPVLIRKEGVIIQGVVKVLGVFFG